MLYDSEYKIIYCKQHFKFICFGAFYLAYNVRVFLSHQVAKGVPVPRNTVKNTQEATSFNGLRPNLVIQTPLISKITDQMSGIENYSGYTIYKSLIQ